MKKNVLKIICIVFLSCNEANSPDTQKNSTADSSMQTINTTPIPDTISYSAGSTPINLNNNNATIKGSISATEKPAILLEIAQGSVLLMKVQSLTANGNIRINQIKFPDGRLDGPLGDSISYPITQKGLYTIFLGENLMAGDAWEGNWVLSVSVK